MSVAPPFSNTSYNVSTNCSTISSVQDNFSSFSTFSYVPLACVCGSVSFVGAAAFCILFEGGRTCPAGKRRDSREYKDSASVGLWCRVGGSVGTIGVSSSPKVIIETIIIGAFDSGALAEHLQDIVVVVLAKRRELEDIEGTNYLRF